MWASNLVHSFRAHFIPIENMIEAVQKLVRGREAGNRARIVPARGQVTATILIGTEY